MSKTGSEVVYILGGLRSYFGIKNGIFKTVRPEILGAEVLKELMKRYGIQNADMLLCGNAAGTGGNIGRLLALEAGIPFSMPSLTIDMQCASGLSAIDIGISKIQNGEAELIIAGGVESASLSPRRIYQEWDERAQERNPEYTTAQFIPGEFGDDAMLLGAERAAKKRNITREMADEIAIRSHQNAMEAQKNHYLDHVILPLFGSIKDEAIRPKMSERLTKRAPKVTNEENGILTSANACTLNDGAAFVILASESWCQTRGITPSIKVVATKMQGADPLCPPLSADEAVSSLLAKENLSYEDISAFEYNEAFAVVTADFMKKHEAVKKRINQWGGALAYGHPFGASGAEILIHLMEILKRKKGKYGVAAVPAAGGVGQAILVERVE